MWSDLTDLFLPAFWETLAMVGVSGGIGALFGVPLGVLLYLTTTGGVLSAPAFNRVAGLIVNAVRSVPFIILLVAVIPFTRLLAGSSIGTAAAIVPLTIAAIPFVARLVETALREVDRGLIEAAQSMGLNTAGIVRHGIPDHWIHQDSRSAQLNEVGLDADGIARMIRHAFAPDQHACFIAKRTDTSESRAFETKPADTQLGV